MGTPVHINNRDCAPDVHFGKSHWSGVAGAKLDVNFVVEHPEESESEGIRCPAIANV